MWCVRVPKTSPHALTRCILLGYLQVNSAYRWPGGDGLTEDDVLSCYPLARDHGEVPDHDELCRRHAELSEEIDAFFSSQKWAPPGPNT